ncbi:MAG: LD-carboxypeptidase [Bacteroidota bacterium]
MKRRRLLQQLSLLPLAPALAFRNSAPLHKRRKPKRLQKGDTIGLITPGSSISDEGLQKAVTNIESLGFQVKLGTHVRAERGYNAGTDAQRLSDLHQMFEDWQVAGIWCVRGGYGCTRLLPKVDFKLIKKNPKIFIGYSDITALHHAIFTQTGLICFHGPVGASDFNAYTVEQLKAVLVEGRAPFTISLAAAGVSEEPVEAAAKTYIGGAAAGQLAGGNLSLLSAMQGTPFALDAKDKLLFLEEVGEKPYRVDRMLTQLRQSARLDKAAGFALGIFNDCEPDEDDRSLSLEETLKDRLQDLSKPTMYGLPFGHIQQMCTLPIGINARLDTNRKTLTLLESAVS